MAELGEWFQAQCRSPEWRAALVVYEKYRRSCGWEHQDLLLLTTFAEGCSRRRKLAGKSAHLDILVQEVSAFAKSEDFKQLRLVR